MITRQSGGESLFYSIARINLLSKLRKVFSARLIVRDTGRGAAQQGKNKSGSIQAVQEVWLAKCYDIRVFASYCFLSRKAVKADSGYMAQPVAGYAGTAEVEPTNVNNIRKFPK